MRAIEIFNTISNLMSDIKSLEDTIKEVRGEHSSVDADISWRANVAKDQRYAVKILYSEYQRLCQTLNRARNIEYREVVPIEIDGNS